MAEYDSDYSDEENQPQFTASNAMKMGAIDEEGHIQVQDLYGVQHRIFTISLPAGVTLEKLQEKNRNGIYWEMPDELKETLRQISSTRNRSNATGEDRVGSVKKMMLLGAEIISERSTCPKPLALDIPGLVPQCNNAHTVTNWIIEPGQGHTVMLNQNIFNPDNIFTKMMLEHNQKCDLDTLNRTIKLDHDPKKETAIIETASIPWYVLDEHLDVSFPDCADLIRAENAHAYSNPHKSYAAKVPYDVAKQLYDSIAGPLKEYEKGYTDIDSWRVRFRPADGEAWNHTEGLINESYGLETDDKEFEADRALHTPVQASVRLHLSYVLGGQ